MADTKITALTALTAADPANDVIPIVDVSDTTMAASGTTKKISVNNILGASGTATLASATITGALGAAGLNVTSATIPANGVYLGSANNLSFSAASTLGMTLNSTGLAIGVTPNTWTSYKALQVQSASIWSTTGNDTAYASNVYYDGAYKYRGGSSDKACMYIQFAGQHQWHYTASAGTAGNTATFTQGMTLDANGRLLIGKTASALGTVGIEEAAAGYIQATVTSDASLFCNRLATDGETIKFYRQTVQVGNISVTTTATAYNTSSDYRLKESVQPLVGGLARVNALKPSAYKWKANGSAGEGFLAHELSEVVPFAVTGDKDAVDADGKPAYQGVDLSKVVPVLVAAIQELTAEVNALKNA